MKITREQMAEAATERELDARGANFCAGQGEPAEVPTIPIKPTNAGGELCPCCVHLMGRWTQEGELCEYCQRITFKFHVGDHVRWNKTCGVMIAQDCEGVVEGVGLDHSHPSGHESECYSESGVIYYITWLNRKGQIAIRSGEYSRHLLPQK